MGTEGGGGGQSRTGKGEALDANGLAVRGPDRTLNKIVPKPPRQGAVPLWIRSPINHSRRDMCRSFACMGVLFEDSQPGSELGWICTVKHCMLLPSLVHGVWGGGKGVRISLLRRHVWGYGV